LVWSDKPAFFLPDRTGKTGDHGFSAGRKWFF
jgi:hypothetical protein